MTGHSVSMQKRSHRLGRIPCSDINAARTAAGVGYIREKALDGRADHLLLIAERELHG